MSRVPHLTLSSFHDYLYSTGESELDSSPAPATHHGARSPPCEQETAIAAGAWGVQAAPDTLFLLHPQRDCGASRGSVFTVLERTPVYKTLLRPFSPPPLFLLGSL